MFSPDDRKEDNLWLVKSFLTPVSFQLEGGRIAPRSVRLGKGKDRSHRTSCFLETGTAGCPPFSNLASDLEKQKINRQNYRQNSDNQILFLFLIFFINSTRNVLLVEVKKVRV